LVSRVSDSDTFLLIASFNFVVSNVPASFSLSLWSAAKRACSRSTYFSHSVCPVYHTAISSVIYIILIFFLNTVIIYHFFY
jgi:hypothetical protein